MNGVLMGGANSNAAMYVRCGGYRNADGTRWNAPTAARGFRCVNGVDRGGSTHISWKAYQYRIGNRETNTRRTSGGGLGFRL